MLLRLARGLLGRPRLAARPGQEEPDHLGEVTGLEVGMGMDREAATGLAASPAVEEELLAEVGALREAAVWGGVPAVIAEGGLGPSALITKAGATAGVSRSPRR